MRTRRAIGVLDHAISVIVGRTDREDAEANSGPLGLEQAIGDFVHGAVASGRGDDVEAGLRGLPGQFDGVTGFRCGLKGNVGAPFLAQSLEPPGGTMLARRGVEDYTQLVAVHL
jgi:hypothetical protein